MELQCKPTRNRFLQHHVAGHTCRQVCEKMVLHFHMQVASSAKTNEQHKLAFFYTIQAPLIFSTARNSFTNLSAWHTFGHSILSNILGWLHSLENLQFNNLLKCKNSAIVHPTLFLINFVLKDSTSLMFIFGPSSVEFPVY